MPREVWTPRPWKYSRPGWIRLGTTRARERCPCPRQRVGTGRASKRFWNSVIPCLQCYGAAGKGRLQFQRWLRTDCSAEKFLRRKQLESTAWNWARCFVPRACAVLTFGKSRWISGRASFLVPKLPLMAPAWRRRCSTDPAGGKHCPSLAAVGRRRGGNIAAGSWDSVWESFALQSDPRWSYGWREGWEGG